MRDIVRESVWERHSVNYLIPQLIHSRNLPLGLSVCHFGARRTQPAGVTELAPTLLSRESGVLIGNASHSGVAQTMSRP